MSKSALVDRRHLDFLLYEVLKVDGLARYPRYAAHSREVFDATIDLAHRIAEEQFLPHNRAADNHEPHMDAGGKVVTIPEVKAALRAFAEAGFMSVTADEADGGMQLPSSLWLACEGLFMAANVSTAGYAMLSSGVAALLDAHGTAEQKRRYRQPILEGRYMGTMCLSEPQAGSSLGDIRVTAEPQADGSYRLSGAKMWISGGDHELSENIIHMVLAKIPGGPPGVKGISLFVVPRFRVNADGSLGARNDVALAGVNHKMGQRGIVNTFLKFGEQGACYGELVGAPHQGLACMFHLMNEARIGVGLGAVMLGTAGYLYSLQYAQERKQGRLLDQKNPASPPVAIIEHADVRRMLIQQKSWVEAAHALTLYTGTLVDIERNDPDEKVRRESHLLLELLTPIVKAWSADWMLKANELAIQILGGYGYTREYPVEQHYRDNRINPIHEGTNGIQAMDLLGRKLTMDGGAALKLLGRELRATIAACAGQPVLAPLAEALKQAAGLCIEVAMTVGAALAKGQARGALAHAHQAMTLYGHTVMAWMWLKQALVAAQALPTANASDAAFYQGKLAAAQWFIRHELPAVEHSARVLKEMDPILLELKTEWL